LNLPLRSSPSGEGNCCGDVSAPAH
jgi:hypothetical protein